MFKKTFHQFFITASIKHSIGVSIQRFTTGVSHQAFRIRRFNRRFTSGVSTGVSIGVSTGVSTGVSIGVSIGVQ